MAISSHCAVQGMDLYTSVACTVLPTKVEVTNGNACIRAIWKQTQCPACFWVSTTWCGTRIGFGALPIMAFGRLKTIVWKKPTCRVLFTVAWETYPLPMVCFYWPDMVGPHFWRMGNGTQFIEIAAWAGYRSNSRQQISCLQQGLAAARKHAGFSYSIASQPASDLRTDGRPAPHPHLRRVTSNRDMACEVSSNCGSRSFFIISMLVRLDWPLMLSAAMVVPLRSLMGAATEVRPSSSS